jgi:hypothetical protein
VLFGITTDSSKNNRKDPTQSSTQQQTQKTTLQPSPTPAKKIEGWKTYRNEEYNFVIQYPSDWSIDGRVYPGKRITFLPGFNYSTDKEAGYPVPGDVSLLLSILNIAEDARLQTVENRTYLSLNGFDTLHRKKEYKSPGPEDYIAIGSVSVVKDNCRTGAKPIYKQTNIQESDWKARLRFVEEVAVNIDGKNVFILSVLLHRYQTAANS